MAAVLDREPDKLPKEGTTRELEQHYSSLGLTQFDPERHETELLDGHPGTATPGWRPGRTRQAAGVTPNPDEKTQQKDDQEKKPKDFFKDVTNETPPTEEQKKGFVRRNAWKAGVGGLILGGAGIGIAGLFSLILPLKVTAILSSLDNIFQSAPLAALQKMEDNLFNDYLAKYVLPGIDSKLCQDTVEITCVSGIDTHNPIGRLYATWKQNHIETKLANDYGIVFGRDEHGKLYMAVRGQNELSDEDLRAVMNGDKTIFDVGTETSITEARSTMRASFKDMSLWDRFFFRNQVGKLAEDKDGITRCIIACNFFDKFNNTVANKKLMAQAAFVRRVISPISEEYSIMFQCLLSPDKAFCSQTLEKVQNLQPGETLDDASLTPFQQQLQSDMVAYAKNTANDLTDLSAAVQTANDIAKQGFLETIVEKAISAVFGDAAGQLGVKAIPVVGWVLFAAGVISFADKIGPAIKFMSYAINAAAAVKLYMMYSTVSSETKSGHVDPQELGSFVQSLSTNMTGAATDAVDATSTPLYNALIGNGTTTNSSKYTCNDGNTVPSGQLVCPEEQLTRGNDIASSITSIVNFVPGLTGLANVINQVNNLVGDLVGGAFQLGCHAADLVPPGSSCSNTLKTAGQYVTQFANWFINILVASPFTNNMSGGRTFDMIAAGADVLSNKSCQVELGCAQLTNQQIADVRNQEKTSLQIAFDKEPLTTRLFSKTSPYSLVSQMAVSMPSTFPAFVADVTSAVGNPFRTFSSIISNVFSGSRVFAAQVPFNDPFGIVQYGYTSSQVPGDPSTYWDQHCQDPNFGTSWLAAQSQDPNTGESLATTPQPCLLIQSAVQSSGTIFDTSFAPAGSLNPNPGTGGASNSSGRCAATGTYSALVSSGATFAGVDQGIDFTPSATGGFDMCAPAPGTITIADQTGHHYSRTTGQALVVEKLDQPPTTPNSSPYIYFDEIIQINSSIHVGSHVNAGDIIGHNAQTPGVEIGWDSGNGYPQCGLGIPTPCGTSFNTWIQAVSAGKTP